jgi:hypothetical protein
MTIGGVCNPRWRAVRTDRLAIADFFFVFVCSHAMNDTCFVVRFGFGFSAGVDTTEIWRVHGAIFICFFVSTNELLIERCCVVVLC